MRAIWTVITVFLDLQFFSLVKKRHAKIHDAPAIKKPYHCRGQECVEPYFHSPNTPSWRGAQLKHRNNFTFYLWPMQRENIGTVTKWQDVGDYYDDKGCRRSQTAPRPFITKFTHKIEQRYLTPCTLLNLLAFSPARLQLSAGNSFLALDVTE
jgi:hypothetical protein